METNKDRKSLFSAISVNRITAARFRKFSKNIAPSHSESLDDMMDFLKLQRLIPGVQFLGIISGFIIMLLAD